MTKLEELQAAGAWIDDVVQGLTEGFPVSVDPFVADEAIDRLADIAKLAAASRLAFQAYMDAPCSGAILTNPDLTPFARASNEADDALDEALRALGRRPSCWADDGVQP